MKIESVSQTVYSLRSDRVVGQIIFEPPSVAVTLEPAQMHKFSVLDNHGLLLRKFVNNEGMFVKGVRDEQPTDLIMDIRAFPSEADTTGFVHLRPLLTAAPRRQPSVTQSVSWLDRFKRKFVRD